MWTTARRDPLLATAVSSTVLLVVLSIAVQLRSLHGIDLWLLEGAQSVDVYPLDVISQIFTYFGSAPWGLIAALVLLVAWREDAAYRWVPLLAFAITIMEWGLKVGINDPIPPSDLHRHLQPAISWLPRIPTVPLSHFHEFPSGHTARAAFIALLTGWRYPAFRVLSVALALGMLLTRIYLGNRFASAAVGGLLLGLAMAAWGLWLGRRIRV